MKTRRTDFKLKELETSKLLLFLLIAFAWSWLLWGVLIFGIIDVTLNPNPNLVRVIYILTPFGPTIAAFVVTYLSDGQIGVDDLWKKFWNFDLKLKWWFMLIVLPLLMFAVPYEIEQYVLIGDQPTPYWVLTPSLILTTFLLNLIIGGLSQEFGWRGFVLPRLQARWNALVSSIIMGVVWAVWLLPSWYLPPEPRSDSFFEWAGVLILWSIIFTWLFNNTRGNLMVAVLFNALGYLCYEMFPADNLYLFIALGIIAGALVLYYGPNNLRHAKRGSKRKKRR